MMAYVKRLYAVERDDEHQQGRIDELPCRRRLYGQGHQDEQQQKARQSDEIRHASPAYLPIGQAAFRL